MRLKRRFGFIVALVLVAGTMAPLGASTPVQTCRGPASTKQSGRASIAPGLNALSTKQQVAFKISLFDCSPARPTRGAGTLNATFATNGGQTCAMVNKPILLKMTAKIVWKDEDTSTASVSFALTGATSLVNVTGRVSSGVFKGHTLSGQLRFKKVVSPYGVSPHGDGSAQACVNKVKPKQQQRVAIVGLNLFTTKHFIIA